MSCSEEQRSSGPTFAVIIMIVVNLIIYLPKMKGAVKRLYIKYQHVVNYGAIIFVTWQSEWVRSVIV